MTYVELGRLTAPEASALADDAVGVVAVGAVEQHGPHLPLATDGLITEELVRRAARRVSEPVVVAPVVATGLSAHHAAFGGTITLAPDVLAGLIAAHVAGFSRMGVRRVALLSAHGGNFGALLEIARGHREDGADVHAYGDFGRFLAVMANAGRAAGLDAPETDSHAGAYETSMVLAIAGPEAVREHDTVEGYVANEPGWLDRMARDGVHALSANGVIGRPAGASAEAGERALDALAGEIGTWLIVTFSLHACGAAGTGAGGG